MYTSRVLPQFLPLALNSGPFQFNVPPLSQRPSWVHPCPQWHFARGAVLPAPCLRNCKLLRVGKRVPLSHVPDPSRSSTKNVLKGFANDKGIHLTFIEHQLCTKPCAKPCRGLYNAKPLGSRLPKKLQTRQCSRESFCTCQGHRGLPQGTLPGTHVCWTPTSLSLLGLHSVLQEASLELVCPRLCPQRQGTTVGAYFLCTGPGTSGAH